MQPQSVVGTRCCCQRSQTELRKSGPLNLRSTAASFWRAADLQHICARRSRVEVRQLVYAAARRHGLGSGVWVKCKGARSSSQNRLLAAQQALVLETATAHARARGRSGLMS